MDREPWSCVHDSSSSDTKSGSDGGNRGSPGGAAGISGFRILDVQNLRVREDGTDQGPDCILVVKMEPEGPDDSLSQGETAPVEAGYFHGNTFPTSDGVQVKKELNEDFFPTDEKSMRIFSRFCTKNVNTFTERTLQQDQKSHCGMFNDNEQTCNHDQVQSIDMEETDQAEMVIPAPSVCIICKTSGTVPLKPFDSKLWGSIKKAAEIRRQMSSDRYSDATSEILTRVDESEAVYHTQCYRTFTAVKRRSSSGLSVHEPTAKLPRTRQRTFLPATDEKGLLKGTCLFCGKVRKKWNGGDEKLSECLTADGRDAIFAAAPRSNNERVKSVVRGEVDIIANEAQYHKSCRRLFFKEADQSVEQSAAPRTGRKLHAETFETMRRLIETEVIGNCRAMLASTLIELYRAEYIGCGGDVGIENYSVQMLMSKIKDRFGARLSISLYDKRQGNFMYNSAMSDNDARVSFHEDREKFEHHDKIRATALYLRSLILSMPTCKRPTPTTLHTLKTCSAEIPESIPLFFKTMICGLREQNENENIERKVLAMSSDAVYNTSKGSIRPWKQTVLGLGLGTLTGSKLALQMLNRHGHSISYDEVKRLETEMAYSASEENRDTPDGLSLKSDLGTGLAWDNYDVNIETLDGKNTLHTTVGICYQNQAPIENEQTEHQPDICDERNLRSFVREEREIPPYRTPLNKVKFSISHRADVQLTEGLAHGLRPIDMFWFLQSRVKSMPLFNGYYSQFVTDKLPLHKICYMDPIAKPPTQNDVVRETMVRSLNVASETNQEYGIVTYDLAVALKAYSIQAVDAPLFDNLLILLGNFHVEFAMFGALGTYIKESGAEYLLVESGVLAEGSLMGFIRGKFYNRCARVHEILANVLERKLYDQFVTTVSQERINEVRSILDSSPTESDDLERYIREHPIIQDHMRQYETFFHETMDGRLGPTAAFWTTYVFIVNRVYRDLQRAVRTNDVSGYLSVLPTLVDIFFALNRQNYARWGTLFLDKLHNAEPHFRAILERGAFSIRRTKKHFSRTAIDICLEQTVNRDAASPMRGIVAFRNSEKAVRRWCITTTQRGMAVRELRRLSGLETTESPAAQLTAARIRKDNESMDALTDALTEACDPFCAPACTSESLINIATGKATDPETKTYLLETMSRGKKLHEKFEKECQEDDGRLLRRVSRSKVQNFAAENTKRKRTSTAEGKQTTEGVRDMFIHMVVIISQHTAFDLRHVLTFPVTQYPLAIAHSDGTPLKTCKAKLLQKLETLQHGYTQSDLPPVDVTLVDGGLLLHTFLSITNSATYGAMARSLLIKVCSNPGVEIHVLFDTYDRSSIKEIERRLRGAEDRPFVISGPLQVSRQSGQQLLKNGNFKDQLAAFVLEEWGENQYGPILGGKILIVSHGGNCCRYIYNAQNECITVDRPSHLQGKHEEADTLIAFHASNVAGCIVVRASDTDVMAILIHMLGRHVESGTQGPTVIMDCGVANNRRYIDLNQIVKALEAMQPGLSLAIIAIHVFTGTDFTTAFYRKGKVGPLEILMKDSSGRFIKAFRNISTADKPDEPTLQEYTCVVYGQSGQVDINEARHAKLLQMTGKINQDTPLVNMKQIDCALLPPCQKSLAKKIARTNYVSMLWGRATTANPAQGLDPLDYGWRREGECLVPEWFSGPEVPVDLFRDNTNVSDSITTADTEDNDVSEDDTDTEPWSEEDSETD